VANSLFGALFDDNEQGDYNRHQHGVFGLHPLMTPKYAVNKGSRDAEFKESLARMYVSLASSSKAVKDAYLNALPDERTRALAKVLLSAGQNVETGFIDFFLTQVNETFTESLQVDKVLGDNYVAFYFGSEPPVFQYSGMLLNSQQDDQRSGFALAYQHLIRGTQLARKGALLRLRYDSVIVSGSVNSMSQVMNAESEMLVPFNFTLLVKEYLLLPPQNFTKLAQEDYVKLATDFSAGATLSQIGTALDVRVRSTMLTPEQLASESSAGQEERAAGGDTTSTPLTTLANKAEEEKAKAFPSFEEDNTRGLTEEGPPPALPERQWNGRMQ
jgi:hypothetical protein